MILFKYYKLKINKKTIINIKKDTKSRIKRKIKENKYLLEKDINNYEKVFAFINNYYYSYKYSDEAKRLVDKYFWVIWLRLYKDNSKEQ